MSDLCEIVTHTPTLHQFQQQRNNQEFCDVTLRAENETFNAHRNVLAAASEYFLKMFTTDMKEKRSQVILIPTVTARALNEILNNIYSGKMLLSEDSLTEILHAASMMQITNAFTGATNYMRDNLSVSNCYLFKDYATLYSLEELLNIIDNFILRNVIEFSDEDQFLEQPLIDIEKLLKSDDLNVVVEKNAFKIVLKWIEKDLGERQQHFPNLFKLVRLQFIPINHILEVVAKNKLVRSFSECRDLIEEAFSFHVNPRAEASQEPRKCEPDSLLRFSHQNSDPASYNLTEKRWKNLKFCDSKNILKDCAVANYYHAITVFCGGIDSNGNASTQVIKLNGLRWVTLPSLNVARCGAAAVFQKSKLFVFGGEMLPVPNDKTFHRTQTNPSTFFFAKSFEILDEDWKQTDNAQQVRSYFAAQANGGKIYLIGGYKPTMTQNITPLSSSIRCKRACKDTTIYFPEEDKWKTSGELNVARASFGCAMHQSSIYVVGGYGDDDSSIQSVEFKNQQDVAWTLCPTSINIAGPMSACVVRNQMYVATKTSSYNTIVGLKFEESDLKEVERISSNTNEKGIVPFSEKFYSLVSA